MMDDKRYVLHSKRYLPSDAPHIMSQAMEQAYLRRTQYLLKHYRDFHARQPPNLPLSVSQAVLEILSFSWAGMAWDTENDYLLLDRCGPLLSPAVFHAAEEIRGFPTEIGREVYPVLYWQYFSPDGMAVDIYQLLLRLQVEELGLTKKAVEARLVQGEKMMAALLFPDRFVVAMRACD